MTAPAGNVDFDTLAARNGANVRKPLKGSVILGDWPSASIIDTLVGTGGLIAVPEGYQGGSVGWISEDGLTFAADTEVSDVRGWGSATFIRRDIQSEDKTMQFAALETKRITHELITGLDLSGIEMSAEGEWRYDLPDRPPVRYWRGLALGVDGDGDNRVYMGKFYPKLVVSEKDDEAWSDGDDPRMYNVTMSALMDDDAGFTQREFLFGPGALAAAERMGITVASSTTG